MPGFGAVRGSFDPPHIFESSPAVIWGPLRGPPPSSTLPSLYQKLYLRKGLNWGDSTRQARCVLCAGRDTACTCRGRTGGRWGLGPCPPGHGAPRAHGRQLSSVERTDGRGAHTRRHTGSRGLVLVPGHGMTCALVSRMGCRSACVQRLPWPRSSGIVRFLDGGWDSRTRSKLAWQPTQSPPRVSPHPRVSRLASMLGAEVVTREDVGQFHARAQEAVNVPVTGPSLGLA